MQRGRLGFVLLFSLKRMQIKINITRFKFSSELTRLYGSDLGDVLHLHSRDFMEDDSVK